jgi:hypothetical protein
MSDLSNSYREQVRDLLRRRIREARTRLMDESKSKVEAARKKAEAQPVIVNLTKLKLRYDDLAGQIKALENEREEVGKKFRVTLGMGDKESYHYRPPNEMEVEDMKSKVVEELLEEDPDLGPKLKDLEALDKQIGDLLVLALTTTKLRAVVTMFNARLGASITDVERQILGIDDED